MSRADVLRTPDEGFLHLPDFPYAPRYGFEGLRGHYIDVGQKAVEHTFLCLHGEPTWSYFYRKIIPLFTRLGRGS